LTAAVAFPATAAVNMAMDFPVERLAAQTVTDDVLLFGDDEMPIILAQSTEPGCQSNCGYESSDSDPAKPPPPPGVSADAIGISPAATKKIVTALSDGAKFCELIRKKDNRLVIDCLADQYRFIALQLPFDSGYAGVRTALFSASEKLHALAKHYSDGPTKTKLSAGDKSTHRALYPVRRPGLAAAKAEDIIEETALVLLRSSQGSDQRRVAYEEVSAVVDSNKVLLRSA